MKIVELQIDDSSLSGFDATALVENPAIEQDFIAFNKVKMAELTHNDYPQAAVDAAKRGIELNEKNDNKCATQVGKVRAQQLVNGEKLSLDTIQRMRSFLIRQKGNYELATKRKDYNACGYISYLLWGGEAALPWAEKKLRQAGLEFSSFGLYENVAFDYDGVLTTAKGKELAMEEIAKGNKVYIISARETKDGMLEVANELGIPDQNVYATKNNVQKIAQVKTLNIDRFYDDNPNVINNIPGIGHKFGELLSNIPAQPTNEPPQQTMSPEQFEETVLMTILENMLGLEPGEITDLIEAKKEEEFEGLDDVCESGYKAIGLKIKNGRKVPNCVPESSFNIDVSGLPNYINEASSGLKHKYFEEAELPSILELKKNKFASQLAEKQMLIGPLMTPNKLIPRVDNITGEEYEVFFSADTIERIAYKMMADKLLDKVNIEHDEKQPVKDVHLVETWLVKDPEHDKSTLYGFKPVTGQWFGIYRIGDGRVWNEYVKTGKVKGFSVEGFFYNNILTNK